MGVVYGDSDGKMFCDGVIRKEVISVDVCVWNGVMDEDEEAAPA